MIGKVRQTWPVRRATSFVSGIWDTFLRDNRVIPPILAVVALLVFAWVVAGSFIGAPEDSPVSSNQEVAQTPEPSQSQVVPEIENPDLDSYAAYESKDPFRPLFESAEADTTTTEDSSEDGSSSNNSADDNGTTSNDGGGSSGGSSGGGGSSGDGNNSGNDGSSGGSGSGGGDGNGNSGGTVSDPPRQDPTAGAGSGQYGDQGDITGSGNGNQSGQGNADDGQDDSSGSGGSGDLFDSGGDLSPGGRGGNR